MKRSSASPGEVHRGTTEGKFTVNSQSALTLLLTLKPLQCESPLGTSLSLCGAVGQVICPWLSLPMIHGTANTQTHPAPVPCESLLLCPSHWWCMFFELLLEHQASCDHLLTGRTVTGKTHAESKTFQQLIQLINLQVLC